MQLSILQFGKLLSFLISLNYNSTLDLIDDCYGMWTHTTNTDLDHNRWTLFQNGMNAFGTNLPFFHNNQHFRPLTWEFEEQSNEVIFLDLRISILNGHINTTIYEKPLNLHIYIQPHSCHSPGVLKGLVFGFAKRAKALCTTHEDHIPFMKKTFMRLLDRGHDPATLCHIFHKALKVFQKSNQCERGLLFLFGAIVFRGAEKKQL